MKKFIFSVFFFLFAISTFSHHGVAAIGLAGLEGPGAPLETSSSVTIPEKSVLFYSIGFTGTKMLGEKWTYLLDLNYILFQEYKYQTGFTYRFGEETRVNNAIVYRFFANQNKKTRLDGGIEINYLNLKRDKEDGFELEAAGGDIIYAVPNLRFYIKNSSFGFGLKFPIWKDLNEGNLQQGSEGKER